MKLHFLLLFVTLFSLGCQFSSNEKAISEDVCNCMDSLVQVNEQIKHTMNNGSQGEVMNLFIKAGEEHTKALDCILGLSNNYGAMDKDLYKKVKKELEVSCVEALEPFEKSKWHKPEH